MANSSRAAKRVDTDEYDTNTDVPEDVSPLKYGNVSANISATSDSEGRVIFSPATGSSTTSGPIPGTTWIPSTGGKITTYPGGGVSTTTTGIATGVMTAIKRATKLVPEVVSRLNAKYAGIIGMRKMYYDETCQPWALSKATAKTSPYPAKAYPPGAPTSRVEAAFTDEQPPNLISSIAGEDIHLPAIDVDMPVRVVESMTPGHYHLFIDKPMKSDEYFAFLDCLASFGIVEEGYAEASRAKGGSFVRIIDDKIGPIENS